MRCRCQALVSRACGLARLGISCITVHGRSADYFCSVTFVLLTSRLLLDSVSEAYYMRVPQQRALSPPDGFFLAICQAKVPKRFLDSGWGRAVSRGLAGQKWAILLVPSNLGNAANEQLTTSMFRNR